MLDAEDFLHKVVMYDKPYHNYCMLYFGDWA